MLKYLAPALCLLAAPALAQGMSIKKLDPALDGVIAPGTKIEKVATGFIFIEGPMWKDGKLWFSDVRMDKVRTFDPKTNKVTVILNDSGGMKNAPPTANFGSNGMITDKDGSLLLTRMYAGTIEKMDDKGGLKPFLSKYEGKRFNSPNDLAIRKNGDIFFTDPIYGLPGHAEDPRREIDFCGVYRLQPDGTVSVQCKEISRPNGIAFSPDHQTLYVANSDGQDAVWRSFPVQEDGNLGAPTIFFDSTKQAQIKPGGGDGLKVDKHGNVFATGPGGVLILSPQGKLLGRIMTGERIANVAWGNDGSVLYLTSDMYLCRIQTKTVGSGF